MKIIKLKILLYKYQYLVDLIIKLTEHIYYMDNIFLLDINKKNILLNIIYKINKNINNTYNKYIKNFLNTPFNIEKYINFLVNENVDVQFNIIKKFFPLINKLPFYNEENELQEIIKEIGIKSIVDIFNIYNINLKLYPKDLNNLINELNNIFIPISFNYFKIDTKSEEDYFWKIPKKYKEDDILELICELWIKTKSNNYIKIEGIFKNDILGITIKTSELIYKNLFEKKSNIIKELKNINDPNINMTFIKKFIRYDYIGNIYCMKIEEYIDYILNSYSFYLQLTKSSFINIMKDFVSKGSQLNKMYKIIFLLLLGNTDNADTASLLLGLTKEKKINAPNVYNLINKRLPFYMQLKIKKGNINIKTELEKIKNINIENIDYKKQLLTIKNIPHNIKNITLEKIEEMKIQNNEYYKQKTFVESILKYPWLSDEKKLFEDSKIESINYINTIKNKLNNLTYGHIEAKELLLQTIGQWISNPNSNGKPLGFVGPPGVGKTLLAKSIASALNIPFAEITLGGQNDGEILHGHGYTYSGSQPGMIIKKMVEMGKEKCILYFDELDKTASKHGHVNEITSILIHLTDPNMNKSFQDRFFQGIDFPLNKTIMIFSYNDSEKIDPILLDRLYEIKIKSYTINEKIIITRDFIINELTKNIGLTALWTKLNDDLIEYIINNYTNEAGVRDIKRKIEKIFLTINLDILCQKIKEDEYILTYDEIKRILQKPTIEINKIHQYPLVGIINGLYATTNGDGGIIPIQIFNDYTSPEFEIKLTGSQGVVMKESVSCALTCAIDYIKQNLNKYKVKDDFLNNFKHGFHIHAPSTSTPKDGPSAGGAFTCAFISRILNLPIKNNIGLTGEIELTGKIMKIGGLNFKLIGAKKSGIKTVYIPKENQEELHELQEKYIKLFSDDFTVITVDHISDFIDDILII